MICSRVRSPRVVTGPMVTTVGNPGRPDAGGGAGDSSGVNWANRPGRDRSHRCPHNGGATGEKPCTAGPGGQRVLFVPPSHRGNGVATALRLPGAMAAPDPSALPQVDASRPTVVVV